MLQKFIFLSKVLTGPFMVGKDVRKVRSGAWDDFVYFLVGEQARNGFC